MKRFKNVIISNNSEDEARALISYLQKYGYIIDRELDLANYSMIITIDKDTLVSNQLIYADMETEDLIHYQNVGSFIRAHEAQRNGTGFFVEQVKSLWHDNARLIIRHHRATSWSLVTKVDWTDPNHRLLFAGGWKNALSLVKYYEYSIDLGKTWHKFSDLDIDVEEV